MKIFNYDNITGEFLSAGLADQDPLNDGQYLLPAHATFEPPPEVGVNQVACFKNGGWELLSDPRGEYFDAVGNRVIIDNLLTTPTAGLTKEKPALAVLEEVRAALQVAIDMKAREFGFSSGNALILYAGFANSFQTLAQTFASWEVRVWVEADAYKQQVINNNALMPTPEQAVAMMPAYPDE